MNYLEKIEIKNFRGFDKISIDDFNQINLLIGKNNSGKSSILEAIFLLIGMSNPILPDNINRMRGLNIRQPNDFRYLFHKLKFNNSPEFFGTFSDLSSRNLKLLPIYRKTTNTDVLGQKSINNEITFDASTASSNVNGLELEFSLKQRHNQNKTYKSSIIFNPPELIPNVNSLYKEELHAVLISGNTNEINALTRYSEIVKKKKGDIILEALRAIDTKIESLHPLPDGLYFGYSNIEELVPSNIAGDGVRKFLNIATTIAEKKDSIVLIDEIENGLHYSAHKQLWKSIISLSKEFNVQLFITTHSIETLRCLKELLEETNYAPFQKNIAVYTVSHTQKSGIKTYKYSYEGFKDAIDTETEIR